MTDPLTYQITGGPIDRIGFAPARELLERAGITRVYRFEGDGRRATARLSAQDADSFPWERVAYHGEDLFEFHRHDGYAFEAQLGDDAYEVTVAISGVPASALFRCRERMPRALRTHVYDACR